jgi:predicted Rossmann fold flavoprotein
MERVGCKMRITGKGRCNITNAADVTDIIHNIQGNGRFMNSSLHAFDNQDVIRFFEDNGVPTKVERGNRVFPQSDKAEDAVNAMLVRLHELKVEIQTGAAVKEILRDDHHVAGVKLSNGAVLKGDAVILATGGASYPGTGSTGDGYRMAEHLGHSLVPLTPSLVPLETEEEWVKDLQGLSLRNVRVHLLAAGKPIGEEFGEMMFTHFGVTGPIVLSLSREASLHLAQQEALEMVIDLKPALTEEKLDARLQRDFASFNRKDLHNAMKALLPHRLIAPVIDLAFLEPDKPVHQITKKERQRLVETLKHISLTVTRPRPLAEAIVTAGGVKVQEIDPKTMASKLVPGLYFAGEVVDVDGFTGGYNLQAAFSMGAAAGKWSARQE